MRRKLSLNPWWAEGMFIKRQITFPQIIEAIAEMEVDGLDMNDIYLQDGPNPDPRLIRQARRLCAAAGLEIMSCWYYTDLAGAAILGSPEAAVAHVARLLAVTETLGSKFLVISNGNLPKGTSAPVARSMLMKVYDGLIPLAEEHDIVIGLHAGRARTPFTSPGGALELVKEVGSRYLTVTPDFEAWRRPAAGMPVRYTDNPNLVQDTPLDVGVFQQCLPHAPVIHAKFLDVASGDEPNYPLDELFAAINGDSAPHNICIEYEGWIPEVHPERDPVAETRTCVEIVRRRLRQ
jgi:hypothetical protein